MRNFGRSAQEKMIRLFAAPRTRLRLALMGAGASSARWQNEDKLHPVLQFIGQVRESTAVNIHDALFAILPRAS